jgi:hypothetical protein
MRRREFITFIGSAVTVPLLRGPVAGAQESERVYKLGVITGAARQAPRNVALFDELRGLGFIEGQNLKIIVDGFARSSLRKPLQHWPNLPRTLSFASVILRCAPHRFRPGPFPSLA